MKILHILSQIPEATGSGIYLQAAIQHAARRGFYNYLLAGLPENSPLVDNMGHLDCLDHCVVRFGEDLFFPVVGMSDVMPYPSARFCDLSAADLMAYEACFKLKLAEAVERWQPDLIHSHHLWLLTSLARRQYPQLPLLATCHGSDLRQFHSCAHLRAQVLKGCRQLDAVSALGAVQKEEIHRLYGIPEQKIHITGAGFNTERFYFTEKAVPRPAHILYAGKLSRAKGVVWLLQALKRLPVEDFVFHLVGDSSGAEKQEILALTEGFGSRIRVYGNLPQEELAALMRQAHLFVLPSFYEGLPLVLLEALASGCRVVATALPGVIELFSAVQSNWVSLVDLPEMATIDTPEKWAEETFTRSLEAALGSQLQQIIRTGIQEGLPATIEELLRGYSWEGIFQRIENLYRRLLVQ